MKYLKMIIKNIGITLLIILVSILLITLLNYFGILKGSILSIFKILIVIIAMFIGGFLTGKNSNSKGWLEGLKFGLILSIMFIIFSLILKNNFEFKNLLYYLILTICSILGSMIGISKTSNWHFFKMC